MKLQETQPDRTAQSGQYDTILEGWLEYWETPSGLAVACLVLAAASGALFFGQLGALGIWEPWEANEILVAQEYQDREPPPPPSELGPKESSYNWAVPTKDGKPVARSLLKTWLISWSLGRTSGESEQPKVGQLEFSARFPVALGAFLLVFAGFFWLRDVFDTWSALIAGVAFLSTPALYIGVHTLSSETLSVATTSLAVIAFAKLVYSEGRIRYLWGAAFGVGLTLSFLDQRFFGLLVPLGVTTGFALAQLPYLRAIRVDDDFRLVGVREMLLAFGALLAGAGFAAWGFWTSAATGGDTLLLPHVEQLFAVFLPLSVLLAGLCFAWRTRAARALRSPPGLLGIAIFAGVAVFVLEAYADANPTLLKNGRIVGTIPVLEFLLQNDLFGAGPGRKHPHFAMWFRQLGFSMVPVAAFVPLGLGYLSASTRLTDETGAVREDIASEPHSIRRLLLVWSFVGVLVIGAGSIYGHYYVPIYYPLIAGIGLLFGDADFWRRARLDSLLQYLMGFVAVAIVLMLAKDLNRFPARFLEPYMAFESDLGLPDDFEFGAILDGLKYTWIGVSAVFFFGIASRLFHEKYRDVFLPLLAFASLVGIPYVWGYGPLVLSPPSVSELGSPFGLVAVAAHLLWLGCAAAVPVYLRKALRSNGDEYLAQCTFVGWGLGLATAFGFASFSVATPASTRALSTTALGRPAHLAALGLGIIAFGATTYFIVRHLEVVVEWFGRRWSNLAELFSDEGSAMRERSIEKEQLRREESPFGVLARVLETPQTFAAVLGVTFLVSGGIFLYGVVPRLGNHLSQRGIFETYTQIRDDAKLYRLRVSTRETSVYLRDVPRLESTREFLEKFGASKRFFAVIPRDQLSSLNTQVRKKYARDIPVLDARSSQILLVSNRLEEGETNHNFIARAIVEDRSKIQHEVTFEHKGQSKHPTFDDRLKLLGYSLDKKGDPPTYGWGETAVLKTYFEVLRPVSTNQKIFLHVDYPGSRIHGDHYPMGGDFPTSDWPKGAVVVDEHHLEIDPYASTGVYTLFFGFYRAGQRMRVEPPAAHDGQNRIPMGKIRVSGF